MAHLHFAGKSAAILLLLILGLLGAVQLAMAQSGLQSSYLIDLSSRLTADYEGAIHGLSFAPAAAGLLAEISRSELQEIVVVAPVINLAAPGEAGTSGEPGSVPPPAGGPAATATATATNSTAPTSSHTPTAIGDQTPSPTPSATATLPG
ncbi:MAG: hypothetical protein KDE28_00470, partial [Anaerolineales bacterium]|nr:hypothetical protein [Anaerolineales bacterium]